VRVGCDGVSDIPTRISLVNYTASQSLIAMLAHLQIQQSLVNPPTVKELMDKTKHMNDEEKQNMAMKYFLQAQRYEAGKEVPRGGERDVFARHYYDASSRLGNIEAMNRMGVFHSKGRGGLPINEEKAFKEFKSAADAGLARAQRNLSTYYARGGAGQFRDCAMAYLLLNEVR
jgi:TPR repeat protein